MPTREDLFHLYIKQRLNTSQIGALYGRSQGWAYQQLRAAGVPTRHRSSGPKNTVRKGGEA